MQGEKIQKIITLATIDLSDISDGKEGMAVILGGHEKSDVNISKRVMKSHT